MDTNVIGMVVNVGVFVMLLIVSLRFYGYNRALKRFDESLQTLERANERQTRSLDKYRDALEVYRAALVGDEEAKPPRRWKNADEEAQDGMEIYLTEQGNRNATQ
jgi:hypothetical protein